MSNIFNSDIENFGVLLKGKSVKSVHDYHDNFDACFVVNNFERELLQFENILKEKEVAHFINRLPTAPMSYSSYMAINIEKIMFMKPFDIFDINMLRNYFLCKVLRKKVFFLPRSIQRKDWGFGDEYKHKFPNAGILSLIYVLEVIKPKNLWVFGLDFYHGDYLSRRSHQNPIELQREKFDRLNLIDFTSNLFSCYEETKINIVTSCEEFPAMNNVNKIIYNDEGV
jgi:hypothetical protein